MEKKPWSPASDGGKELVKDPPFHDKLIDNWTLFTSSLEIDHLWPKMIEYKVVTIQKKEDIQVNGRRPRIEQVQDLLVHLTLGPVWRLQAFLKVLTLTGNNHLLHHLGLNEDEYADSPMPKRVGIVHCPHCLDIYEKPYTLVACKHQLCRKCLTNIKPAGGGQSIAITCPLPTCNTESTIKGEDKENLKMHIDEKLDSICSYLKMYINQAGNCVVCDVRLSACDMIHKCEKCNGKLCSLCYGEHKSLFSDHNALHQHSNKICCRHGKKTVQFCDQEKIYICNLCVRDHCRSHSRSSFPIGDFDELMDTCKKLASIELKKPQLLSCKAELLTMIKKAEDHLIEMVELWAQEQKWIILDAAKVEQEKYNAQKEDAQKRKGVAEYLHEMTDYISHMPEIAISDLKKKLVSQDTKPSIIVGFTLPKLDFVAANLESLRQGLKKWTEVCDEGNKTCDTPPFPLPPLPQEIQGRNNAAPTKGHLICNSSRQQYQDIAWFNDGSLLAGQSHGKAAWRISFSPDYSHVTTRKKLHSGAPAKRVSTSPDGGWAFCATEDSLYICNPGEEEATLWDPGFKVWEFTLIPDRIILGTAYTIKVYNKNKDLLYEKEISSKTIQFRAYNRQTNTFVFTAGTKGDPSYLYVTSLNNDSPVYRISRFSDEGRRFKYPLGLCTDQSCNIYVPDNEANAIFVFDRVGRFLHKLNLDKPRLIKPWSLSILEQPDKPPILAVDEAETSTIYLYKLS